MSLTTLKEWGTQAIATASDPIWQTFQFGDPRWLWLLTLIPLLWWRRSRRGEPPAIQYSSIDLLREAARQTKARRSLWPLILHSTALALIVLALAQPRIEKDTQEQKTEGIDILLVLDASRSMDSKDFDYEGEKISRRDALHKVIGEFIEHRTRDRIGVLAFAERPFLVSPLTLDHSWMMESLAEIQTSLGTAIGSAVEASVDLLRQADSPNKVAIVVTDGLNTSGVDPLRSAQTAQRFGIRLYTVGVVSYDEMQTGGLDKITLNKMGRMTGGQFFQAANGASLRSIYSEIDRLERKEFKQSKLRAYKELFHWFAAAALVLLLLDIVIAQGWRARVP